MACSKPRTGSGLAPSSCQELSDSGSCQLPSSSSLTTVQRRSLISSRVVSAPLFGERSWLSIGTSRLLAGSRQGTRKQTGTNLLRSVQKYLQPLSSR